MAFKTRALDVTAAYVGMTVRHAATNKTYTVVTVTPPSRETDTTLTIKNARGGTAYVGHGMIDPDEFVSLHTV